MKRVLSPVLFFALWFLLFACAGSDKKPVLSDAQLLQQAEEALAAKKYEKAQGLLKRLMAEYQKFLDLHPRHQLIDEAHYYLGLSYFAEISTVDRDQSPTQRALAEFQALVKEAPDSRYASEAREKIKLCQEKLAGHELFVGRFYFRKGKYNAACGRLRYLLSHYPGTSVEENALYYLGESYYRLKEKEKATYTFLALLERYPDSDYESEVRVRLAELKAP